MNSLIIQSGGEKVNRKELKMLKGNNDQQLSAQNIYECVIPFYQIWQELVSEKTLDVYQYRVLNSLNALNGSRNNKGLSR